MKKYSIDAAGCVPCPTQWSGRPAADCVACDHFAERGKEHIGCKFDEFWAKHLNEVYGENKEEK